MTRCIFSNRKGKTLSKISLKAAFTTTLALSVLLALNASTFAATTSFTGNVLSVLTDTGTGVYTGVTPGALFTGSFTYGDTEAQATAIFTEPTNDERDWEFNGAPFNAFITQGSTTTSSNEASINIENDFPLDSDSVALINLLLPGVVAGDPVDVWSANALSTGASFDVSDNLINGIEFELAFLKLGTTTSPPTLFNDLTYQPMAPSISDADITVFVIEEADDAGNTIFLAVGTVNSVNSVVPEPASLTLLVLGSGLMFARRRCVA